VHYLVGTMIELPRACLVADEIAKEAEFFSFGTNDLTQTTFGFSRDDVNKILPTYLAEGILKAGPICINRSGRRWRTSANRNRTRPQNAPELEVGICGEHGGDPSSWNSATNVEWITSHCSPIAALLTARARLQPKPAASEKLKGKREGRSREGFVSRIFLAIDKVVMQFGQPPNFCSVWTGGAPVPTLAFTVIEHAAAG